MIIPTISPRVSLSKEIAPCKVVFYFSQYPLGVPLYREGSHISAVGTLYYSLPNPFGFSYTIHELTYNHD